MALAQIIAGLKDREGKNSDPWFDDDVKAPSEDEVAAWKKLPFDEEEYREKEVGASKLVGEKGYSVLARTWVRPTLDVHGIVGGIAHRCGLEDGDPGQGDGEGVHAAGAGNDAGEEHSRSTRNMWRRSSRRESAWRCRPIHSGEPIVIGTDNPYVKAATKALKKVWGKDTGFIRSGGSIPIVGDFEKI